MPNATLEEWTTEDDSTTYGRNPLFPNSRAGCAKPRRINRLEGYALRSVTVGDSDFSRSLIQFLREFNAALHKPITLPGVGRRTGQGAPEDVLRVPPFVAHMEKDEAEVLAELDVEAAVASLSVQVPVAAAVGPSRPLPHRKAS